MAATNVAPHKRRAHKSKRVQNVISRWRRKEVDDEDDGEEEEKGDAPTKPKQKRARKK